ncbi:MAG TPA: A24 family peptidase [Pirellulales bacterium]|jgi:prepilin signal peptidase PulO-like enzyme (type II secretory pathway)
MRFVVLYLIGAAVARLVNWFSWWLVQIQQPLAIVAAPRSATASRHGSKNVRWSAWVPIVGAWQVRRKATSGAGPSGWRPLLLELLLGLGFAILYWWEVPNWELLRDQAPPGFAPAGSDWFVLHAQFASHLLLVTFMLAASLVDIDEQTIPDLVTIPGTLLGFLAATIMPASLLPVIDPANGMLSVGFLNLASPNEPPIHLTPNATFGWLCAAILCFWLWCLALLPWRRGGRRGWRHAVALTTARWRRDPLSIVVVACALVGTAAIGAIWFFGGERWLGLVSSLLGMAACGGLIWAVRIAASWALAREAMGFGDVTLMAMIGSFLGWQTSPMVFFLAPLAGLFVGLIQWFVKRNNVIPYGPFLCLAALFVIVKWGPIWTWAMPLYDLPWLVPTVIAICLVMLAIMLRGWRTLRTALGIGD